MTIWWRDGSASQLWGAGPRVKLVYKPMDVGGDVYSHCRETKLDMEIWA